MAYEVITDFRGGLDARKFFLSLPAGTLTKAVNCHITQGGEIEKRKQFLRIALPAGTFGGQESPSGIVVFGSAVAPSLPAGFVYQRLQHPAVTRGGIAYDAAKHAMTAIIHSCLFGGLVKAVAKFADGYTFSFYNGTVLVDFIAGQVLPYLAGNNVRLSAELTRLANETTAYTAIQQANPNDNKTDIFSLPGGLYSSLVAKTSTLGTLSATQQNAGTTPVSSVSAVGQFQIIAGSAGASNKVNAVTVGAIATVSRARAANVATIVVASTAGLTTGMYVALVGLGAAAYNVTSAQITVTNGTTFTYANVGGNEGTTGDTGGLIGINLLGSAGVAWVTSGSASATAVAAAINAYTATSGYSATSVNNVILITASTAASTPNGKAVAVTAGGNVCIGNCGMAFSLTTGVATFGVVTMYASGVELLGGTVNWSTTVDGTVAAVVTAINARTSTTGYLAYSSGNNLYVSKATTSSADGPVNVVVNFTVVASVNQGGISTIGTQSMTVYASPANVNVVGRKLSTNNSWAFTASAAVTAAPAGGVGPYTYKWQEVTAGSGSGIIISSPSLNSTKFTYPGGVYVGVLFTTKTGQFICIVTDSAGNIASSNPVTVTVTFG